VSFKASFFLQRIVLDKKLCDFINYGALADKASNTKKYFRLCKKITKNCVMLDRTVPTVPSWQLRLVFAE
jgi:hypothetical protein